ncbi:putative ABC transporter permease [Candidatus Formimonas warabiya]|uniref:ABC-transporter type IV n=1 Tax=Formimonas warabiya TaxID=1761012 RepID=A0A3G1KV14_FORW1|nr:hypothetical protein [Candidatus Formimonas warabiya]ATW26276.1 hypothetical protein DCMF_17275 [Candidatus Formimonas warabiya]
MINRFVFYGIIGWCIEVIWTGLASLLRGDLRLVSRTYLWMFAIYGLAVFLEPLHERVRQYSWMVRGTVWMVVIFFIEYTTGYILDLVIGACPWNYARDASLATFRGYIRLDYAPAWFAAGLAFEKIHDYLKRIGIR